MLTVGILVILLSLFVLIRLATDTKDEILLEMRKLSTQQQVEDMNNVVFDNTVSMIRDINTGLLNNTAFDIIQKKYNYIQGLHFMLIETDSVERDEVIEEATGKVEYITSKIGIELLKIANNSVTVIQDIYRLDDDRFLIVSVEDINAIAIMRSIKEALHEYKIDANIVFNIGKYKRLSTSNSIYRCLRLVTQNLTLNKAKNNNH